MSANELVAVHWPCDYLEADAIRQALTEVGVFVYLDGENLAAQSGSGLCGNAGRCRMRVLVRNRDIETARKIIEEGEWPSYSG